MRDREYERPVKTGFGGGQMLLAFLGGAAAGAFVALLNAPRPGRETRARLRAAADDARETAVKAPRALRDATAAAGKAFTETLTEELDAHG